VTAVYLGLGSNLGDRRAYLRQAVALLREHLTIIAVSSLYETAPVGYIDQPPFLNAVAACDTGAPPSVVLAWCQAAETALGRERTVRWGPRTIDIDVLLYGDQVVDTPTLTIPHPRLIERAFALAPLAELAPDAGIPGTGRTVGEGASSVDAAGVVRGEGPEWVGTP